MRSRAEARGQHQPRGRAAAGLRAGARGRSTPKAVNLVVLASDGVANVGDTGPNSIVDTIEEEGADGIHLVTVGYGLGNYNDHLMEQLADLGDGFYAYVDDYAEAEQLFGGGPGHHPHPGRGRGPHPGHVRPALVASYRLIGYDNRAIDDDDFTDPGTDAGELGAGHHATALYEVRLADGVAPGTVIGTAAVRWTPVDVGRSARGPLAETEVDVVAARRGGRAVVPTGAGRDRRRPRRSCSSTSPRTTTGRSRSRTSLERAEALAAADVAGAEELVDRGGAGDPGRLSAELYIRVGSCQAR